MVMTIQRNPQHFHCVCTGSGAVAHKSSTCLCTDSREAVLFRGWQAAAAPARRCLRALESAG